MSSPVLKFRAVHLDRVLVMDAGQVAEFDTPLHLFDMEGSIFRSLCNDANLSREDIIRIRNEALKVKPSQV